MVSCTNNSYQHYSLKKQKVDKKTVVKQVYLLSVKLPGLLRTSLENDNFFPFSLHISVFRCLGFFRYRRIISFGTSSLWWPAFCTGLPSTATQCTTKCRKYRPYFSWFVNSISTKTPSSSLCWVWLPVGFSVCLECVFQLLFFSPCVFMLLLAVMPNLRSWQFVLFFFFFFRREGLCHETCR